MFNSVVDIGQKIGGREDDELEKKNQMYRALEA
jgi:hypothetical protein